MSRDADSHLTSQAAEGLKESMGGERPLGSTVGLRALDDCPTPRVDHKAGGHLSHRGPKCVWSSVPPRKGLQEKDKVWLLREQKRKKKLRKLLKRLQNNDTCSMPGLTCFTHDNHHWQTAPLWTREQAGACRGREACI